MFIEDLSSTDTRDRTIGSDVFFAWPTCCSRGFRSAVNCTLRRVAFVRFLNRIERPTASVTRSTGVLGIRDASLFRPVDGSERANPLCARKFHSGHGPCSVRIDFLLNANVCILTVVFFISCYPIFREYASVPSRFLATRSVMRRKGKKFVNW